MDIKGATIDLNTFTHPQFSKRLPDLNSLHLICLDICLAFWANT